MDLSKRIKEVREAKEISQVAMAEKLGIERQGYHNLEKNAQKTSFERIEKIAEALDVSVQYLLFGGEDIKKSQIEKLEKDLQETSVYKKLLKDFVNSTLETALEAAITGFVYIQAHKDNLESLSELKLTNLNDKIKNQEKIDLMIPKVTKDLENGIFDDIYDDLIFEFFQMFKNTDLEYFFDMQMINNPTIYKLFKHCKEHIVPKYFSKN